MSRKLRSVFAENARVPIASGMNGASVAKAMLEHYGISHVKIVQGQGSLTDHYNPSTKTISLSPDVYNGRSVSAAAVAAHECGHAVQHAEAYSMLQLRSKLVPVVNLSARMQQYFFMFAFAIAGSVGNGTVLAIAVVLYGVTALFALVTLPVEFDASNRALAWLDSSGTTVNMEHDRAKSTLWWAAMTYVTAAIAAITQLLFLVFKLLATRRN